MSCSDDSVVNAPVIDAGEAAEGEKIMFTTYLPDEVSQTRSAKDDWRREVNSYKPVNHKYTFKVEMFKKGDITETDHSYYKPSLSTQFGNDPISGNDGTLAYYEGEVNEETRLPLFWQDNINKWGFRATSVSSAAIAKDQNSEEKWLYQDQLIGYSYLPIWIETEDGGQATDDFDAINYRTSKEWYADNKTAHDLSGLMISEGSKGEEYKKVPLYMKHQRAWITFILKAGEGVKREALSYHTAEQNIAMTINSYENNNGVLVQNEIDKAWARPYTIDYAKDKNGEAQTGVSTTRYDAIVAPHNYATRKDEEIIARINLSGQKFSFYASNDTRYLTGNEAQRHKADNAYNLEAGKHLTIVATLSRESRKILITSWIEDWTEVATQTICDDYGQNGDPVVIKNRTELIAFLSNPKVNKQGSVGIIQPTELKLDIEGENWPETYDLNATLNLAGCVLKTGHRLFNNMSSSANLVNGTVLITDGATVDCAIAETNEGTIEHINVTTTSELTTAKATVAGLVKENHGTVYQCMSSLPVYGTVGQSVGTGEDQKNYIGGIAAVSDSKDGSAMAVIDGCVVNASVNGSETVYGGGIVGYVTGRVSNNTFEYGITVSQDGTYYKNIFAQVGAEETRAYGNAWPTKVLNYINETKPTTNPNKYSGTLYSAVLDSQAELDKILSEGTRNVKDSVYRISKSFIVESSTDETKDWKHGTVNATDHESGQHNVLFTLEGNNKTITLTGNKTVKTTDGPNLSEGTETSYTTAPMLFNYVLGEVRNLTLDLDQPLVASPSQATNNEDKKTYNAEDAIAPLAYGVYGENARLTNIKVKAKNDAYVQASTPAGLVVWVHGGATITNCMVNVPVRMWLPASMGKDAKHYAGGVVACAAKATITQCVYLGNSENSVTGSEYSTTALQSPNYFYGGIVGGTSIKNTEEPELVITDCTSWFIATRAASEAPDQSSKGGIIGYCCFAENNNSSTIKNGMKEGNQGNWWQLSAVGAHTLYTGWTEEKAIGKRNSVTPTYSANF